jgi:diacyltrehalose acyltransferase
LGVVYVHGPPIAAADPLDVPPENTTTVERTSQNGTVTVTTHLVPTKNLPLTQTFRYLGVPDALVDTADQVLRPIIDAGYRRHDEPGDPRPYLHDGEIHRNVQSQQQVREPAGEESGDAQEPGVNPGQQRQAGGDDRLDQIDLDVQESKNDPDVQESKNDPDVQQPKNDPDAQESKSESADQ